LATPIRIDFRDTPELATFLGPYSSGGALYVVGKDIGTRIDVFKSTDNGATWVVQNSAAAPRTNFDQFDAVLSGTSISIVFCRQGTTRYNIQTFSTATDTWGAVSANGPTQQDANSRDQMVRMLRVASGDLYVFFLEETTSQRIRYSAFSGGAWGAETVLVAAAGTEYNYLCSGCVDSLNVMHVFYRKCLVEGDSGTLYHITLTTGGVIGAEQQISATVTDLPTGRAAEIDGALVLPFFNASNLTGVWTGNPTAAPVWAFTLVNNLGWGAGVHDIGDASPSTAGPEFVARPFAFESGGVGYLIWQTTDGPSGGYTINRVYYSRNTGSGWSAPVLFYDEVVDPGAWYGTNAPDISALSAAVVGDELLVIGNVNCEGVAYLGAMEESGLTIECDNPPVGIVGTLYVHEFPAEGGTPPYTFAITAGSLPNGLTLDANTGEVSGTPTINGTFTFTVTVTDSEDAEASVECSITIRKRCVLVEVA
jgi:hypothetical protein